MQKGSQHNGQNTTNSTKHQAIWEQLVVLTITVLLGWLQAGQVDPETVFTW